MHLPKGGELNLSMFGFFYCLNPHGYFAVPLLGENIDRCNLISHRLMSGCVVGGVEWALGEWRGPGLEY